jgi:hypothetical protein
VLHAQTFEPRDGIVQARVFEMKPLANA